MIRDHRIHVLTKREELDTVGLQGKVAIVVDVLFATSTMASALAHGAASVIPALDGAAARTIASALAPGSFVIAGELHAQTIEGFAPPTPLALAEHALAGHTLVYSTTNGTVALKACEGAAEVYCGALLNGRALVERLITTHRDQPVLVVCAGSSNNFNLEDFYGAGYLIDLLAGRLGEDADFSDAARAARALFLHDEPQASLLGSRVGRFMTRHGMEHEVRYCAQLSTLDVVPRLRDGRLFAL